MNTYKLGPLDKKAGAKANRATIGIALYANPTTLVGWYHEMIDIALGFV